MCIKKLSFIVAILCTLTTFSATSAEPQMGGTLAYSFQPEPPALSTIITTAVPTAIASTKIFESLLEWKGAKLTPQPGLAKSWNASQDDKTFTFNLRHDVKWQDGEPFTSADVKFTIKKIIIPFHSRAKVYYSHLSSIDTPTPYKVVFNLDKPVPFFLKAFQPTETPIYPKHILEKENLDKIRQSGFWQHPIGTGPFELAKWKKGSYLLFKKNPNYWKKGHPYLNKIIIKVIPDDNARIVALQNGEIDLAPMSTIPGSAIPLFKNNSNYVVSSKGSEGIGPVAGLMVNLKRKPLGNLKVRKAISLALDRQKIANIIFYGQASPATNPIIHANSIFYDKSISEYEFNPDKAKSLLDDAGLPLKPNGYRFSVDFAGLPYGSSWNRLSEYVRNSLKKIGIDVKLHHQDMGSWLTRVYGQWNYGLASTFLNNYADPSIVFEQEFASSAIQKGGTFNNAMNYRNPNLDKLLAKAAVETDTDKRKRMYFHAERIVHHDMPEIFLVDLHFTNIWNKRVHGLITNGISMYSNWDSVWVDSK